MDWAGQPNANTSEQEKQEVCKRVHFTWNSLSFVHPKGKKTVQQLMKDTIVAHSEQHIISTQEAQQKCQNYCQGRGVARGAGGANRPGRRVEGAPMKPTIYTKVLFYRIISVCV